MASTLTLTYLALGKILQSNSNKLESLKLHVKNTYNLSESEFENVLPKLKAFYGNFKIKLNKHCRSYAKLFEDPWINGKIVISFKTGKELKRSESFGRPKKQFSECSARSKRRKVEELCATVSKDQITSAAIRNIKKPVGRLVKKLIESSGTEFSNLNKKLNRKDVIPLNGAEAVLLLIEAKLTKQQYLLVRHLSASKNANIFPSYQILLEAKKECYPDISSMNVSEEGASIKLQSLLKHTTKRLLQSISTDELLKIPSELVLHAKYGCDGASGQSTYNQSFTNNSLSDSHVFMISLVPLRLAPENNSKTKIWENVRSGSPRYCRPLKFIFAKESRELTQMEIAKIKAEISELNEDIFFVHGKKISVSYKLYLTMLDGKSCQHSNTPSSMTCYICGANPNDMNDIKTVSTFPVTRPFFEFGLSPLHAKIRFMEFILHLSYNLSFKNWKVSKKNGTDVQKAENKKKVQKEFKEKLGLNIDVVKQGCGTTNDGNMARKFFANPEIVASITSVDVNIIKRQAERFFFVCKLAQECDF